MILKKTLILFFLSLFFISCSRGAENHGSFSFGVNRSIKSAPVILASNLGLFAREGVNVETEIESSAVDLMDGLFSKKYDLVGVPVYQAIKNSYTHNDFRIIAVLNRNQSRSLVMNNRIIPNSADLFGKRIGLARNSAADFSLYRFLLFKGMTEDEVSVHYFEPNELAQRLAQNEVDAILSWEPFTSEAVGYLGDDARVENVHLGRDMYWLLITRAEIAESRSEDLSSLLLALDAAIIQLNKTPKNSLKTVAKNLSLSPELLYMEWGSYVFHLELPQSLLLSMEQESAWYQSRVNKELLVHDFLDLMDGAPLSRKINRRVSIVGIGEINAP